LGVDTSGLPASVTRARTWPSPGVSISSARHETGSSPNISGSPRTRLSQRPSRTPRPLPPLPDEFFCATAARANITPPSRSRFPVSTFSTSTSHEASVPNSCVQVPTRPYTAARGAAASSRAMRRISPAGMPHAPAARSGGNPRTSSATWSRPFRCSATGPGSASSSSTSVHAIAASSAASVPGRMKWCSSASSAVRVRRGSTTTTLPPRSRMRRSRPRMSGAVSRLPFDTSGFAPRIRRWSVRSTSASGIDSIVPNIRPDETCFGIWSTVEAV
jgi:hypothetical protein